MKKKDENRNLIIFTEEDALAVLKYGGGRFVTRDGEEVIKMDYGKNNDPNYPFVGAVVHHDAWGRQELEICSWTKKGKYLYRGKPNHLDLFIDTSADDI